MFSKYSNCRFTKEELLTLLIEVNEKIQRNNLSGKGKQPRQRNKNHGSEKKLLNFEIFAKLAKLYKMANQMVLIENRKTSVETLIVIAKILNNWFEQEFLKLPANIIENEFEKFLISQNMTENDINLSITENLISQTQKSIYKEHMEIKRSSMEQKAFRESFFKSNTDFDIDFDDPEIEDDTKLLSIEEAVLIIQKLERKYQAISRRNYVRFVRERANELRGVQVEIDATEAAIRIQARTRGYFARKMVREMREKELEVLGMKPKSLIQARCEQWAMKRNEPKERVVKIESIPMDLESAIQNLSSNYFVSPEIDKEQDVGMGATKDFMNSIFLDACLRGIVAKTAKLEFDELISQKENVSFCGKSLKFDIRSFITITFCIPIALNSWKRFSKCRWILLIGGANSGKTEWAKSISKSCSISHVNVSKNVVKMGKSRIYSVIRKLAKRENQLLISLDRIDIIKKDFNKNGYTHRHILLRNFLKDISHTNATVIGMTRSEDIDKIIKEMFQLQIHLTNPVDITRFDLSLDSLARNMEQDRLPKIPKRLYDIEKKTKGFSNGNTAKFVTNRWGAANTGTKTNFSN